MIVVVDIVIVLVVVLVVVIARAAAAASSPQTAVAAGVVGKLHTQPKAPRTASRAVASRLNTPGESSMPLANTVTFSHGVRRVWEVWEVWGVWRPRTRPSGRTRTRRTTGASRRRRLCWRPHPHCQRGHRRHRQLPALVEGVGPGAAAPPLVAAVAGGGEPPAQPVHAVADRHGRRRREEEVRRGGVRGASWYMRAAALRPRRPDSVILWALACGGRRRDFTILLHPPSTCSRRCDVDGEGVSVK